MVRLQTLDLRIGVRVPASQPLSRTKPSMRLRQACIVALVSVPALMLGQAPASNPEPPKEVDQALRTRVNEFMKFQIDGAYKKAFVMVADDSQDYFLQSNKPKYLSFGIDEITYSNNFTRASVQAHARQVLTIMDNKFEVDFPVRQTWKVEDGSWVWFRDPAEADVIQTPVGGVVNRNPNESPVPGLPKEFNAEVMAKAAQGFAAKDSISKTQLQFVSAKRGEEEIVFHNAAPGVVQLRVNVTDPDQSLTATPAEAAVGPEGDVKIRVTYKPAKKPNGSTSSTSEARSIRLTVEPFGKIYVIPVTISN
jgi:hypothetical protein